jgi:hypothetical protein
VLQFTDTEWQAEATGSANDRHWYQYCQWQPEELELDLELDLDLEVASEVV